MTSVKAYLLTWLVWWQFKGSFQTVEGFHARIKRSRKEKDHGPPNHLRKKFVFDERQVDGQTVYEVSPKSELPSQARILYLHGGAFVFPPTPVHWEVIAKLAERLQAVITVPRYPLGPEHKLLEMYDMLQPLHDEMAASPDDAPFFVAGDSAGGTLAIGVTQAALKAGRPVASRLVLITPCVDCSMTNPDIPAVLATDPWMDLPGIQEIPRLICPELSTKDPRASPIYGDLARLPPSLVFAAGRDLLGPDIRKFADMASAKGSEMVLVEGEGMLHVWPILPIYEAEESVDRIVEWLS